MFMYIKYTVLVLSSYIHVHIHVYCIRFYLRASIYTCMYNTNEEDKDTHVYTCTCNNLFVYFLSNLFVDDRKASSISVDHPREDGVGGRCSVSNSTEVKRNADELLHFSVVLCPHFFQRWSELQLLVPV